MEERETGRLEARKCRFCGKTFYRPSYYGKGYYCSRECSDLAKRLAPNVTCEVCGKPFHLKPYRIKRANHHCCSRSCLAELKKTIFAGGNNHQFGLKGKNNPTFKDEVLTQRNNHLTERLVYVGDWYKKYNVHGRITEHRYIVEYNHNLFDNDIFEEIDGWFYLRDGYEVHHKDLDHNNNDVSNLQVLTKSEHVSLHCKLRDIKRNKKGQFAKTTK